MNTSSTTLAIWTWLFQIFRKDKELDIFNWFVLSTPSSPGLAIRNKCPVSCLQSFSSPQNSEASPMKTVNTNPARRLRPRFPPNTPHEDLSWSLFCSKVTKLETPILPQLATNIRKWRGTFHSKVVSFCYWEWKGPAAALSHPLVHKTIPPSQSHNFQLVAISQSWKLTSPDVTKKIITEILRK